jgi:hypothetical protein
MPEVRMSRPQTAPTVHVGKAWRLILSDLGLSTQTVLRRAGLPSGVLDGDGTRITLDAFYTLWDSMSDEAIMKHLVKFRGIGPWTAEMLLMFHFLRPDIFSLGDIGLIRGTQRLVPEAETKEQVGEIAERWRPYRTAAAWYLWRILDPVPVEY